MRSGKGRYGKLQSMKRGLSQVNREPGKTVKGEGGVFKVRATFLPLTRLILLLARTKNVHKENKVMHIPCRRY